MAYKQPGKFQKARSYPLTLLRWITVEQRRSSVWPHVVAVLYNAEQYEGQRK